MTSAQQALFDGALALPEPERVRLVEVLLDSLSPTARELAADGLEELNDVELLAELEQRRMEVERGDVKPIPWSELKLDA